MVRAHSLEEPVEPPELDACHRADELGRSEVPTGKTGQARPATHRSCTVVDVQRELVDVVAVGDHHPALPGRDDLVELQAEPAGVAVGPKPTAPERRAGRL